MIARALLSMANSGALFLGFMLTIDRLLPPAPDGEGWDNIRSSSKRAASVRFLSPVASRSSWRPQITYRRYVPLQDSDLSGWTGEHVCRSP